MMYQPPRGVLRLLVKAAADEPVRALHDVSLNVDSGEVVGIVGPNGAGKSTLLRAITTLLVPTEGTITLEGRPVLPDDDQIRMSFGLSLPEERSFYWRLTGRQNLLHFAVEHVGQRGKEELPINRGPKVLPFRAVEHPLNDIEGDGTARPSQLHDRGVHGIPGPGNHSAGPGVLTTHREPPSVPLGMKRARHGGDHGV